MKFHKITKYDFAENSPEMLKTNQEIQDGEKLCFINVNLSNSNHFNIFHDFAKI